MELTKAEAAALKVFAEPWRAGIVTGADRTGIKVTTIRNLAAKGLIELRVDRPERYSPQYGGTIPRAWNARLIR